MTLAFVDFMPCSPLIQCSLFSFTCLFFLIVCSFACSFFLFVSFCKAHRHWYHFYIYSLSIRVFCNRGSFMSHLPTFPIERLFQWTTATVTISLGNVFRRRRRCRRLLFVCFVWDAIPLSTWSIFDHFRSTMWWSHSFLPLTCLH